MHTLTLTVQNDEVWQQLLSFVRQFPASQVRLQSEEKEQIHSAVSAWDDMRKALPLLSGVELNRAQPAIQPRDLF
jgi:ABC-type enterochelin transport system ATPase subunit